MNEWRNGSCKIAFRRQTSGQDHQFVLRVCREVLEATGAPIGELWEAPAMECTVRYRGLVQSDTGREFMSGKPPRRGSDHVEMNVVRGKSLDQRLREVWSTSGSKGERVADAMVTLKRDGERQFRIDVNVKMAIQ